jgi:hypothetical protein
MKYKNAFQDELKQMLTDFRCFEITLDELIKFLNKYYKVNYENKRRNKKTTRARS